MPPKKKPNTSTYSGRIGARIRDRREQLDMTVEALRDSLKRRGIEMSISRVYAIENGTRFVEVNHLPAFAAILGLSLHELLPQK